MYNRANSVQIKNYGLRSVELLRLVVVQTTTIGNKTMNNTKILKLLQQAFDALEAISDSDIDCVEDEEEEAEGAPAQYACRKIMEAMEIIQA
jgi:hypothetical protein